MDGTGLSSLTSALPIKAPENKDEISSDVKEVLDIARAVYQLFYAEKDSVSPSTIDPNLVFKAAVQVRFRKMNLN